MNDLRKRPHHSLVWTLVFLVLAFVPFVPQAVAAAPTLQMPIDCALGRDQGCFIQYYFDHDPGPNAQDLFCGPLARNNGKGTAFAVRSLTQMKQGVPVLAAAAGTVLAVRKDLPNTDFRALDKEQLTNKESGNGLVIDHGQGWQTQYNHMAPQGLALNVGETVSAGQKLGLVGRSGKATFPHLYFLVRHNGKEIDPFTGIQTPKGCQNAGQKQDRGRLWDPLTQSALGYTGLGLVSSGFSPGRPSQKIMALGLGEKIPMPRRAATLIFWVESFGIRAKDEGYFEIKHPSGMSLVRKTKVFEKNFARNMTYIGQKAPQGEWRPGRYPALFILKRDGKEIYRLEKQATIR